nr:ThiF family adenylyltransferase [Halobacteriovorax sp. JY17]
MFKLTQEVIQRDRLISDISNISAGALVTFEGWVRDHNEGKKVSSLEYQVYEALANSEGKKILEEAKKKFNLHHIECVHRFGHLKLSETAIWIGATASHRDDAYKASRFVIDEIKHRLPIWKKEHYTEEESKWVFCRDHHTHVHFHEEEYYEKQEKLVDQDRLKEAKVLVIGAGGLGCPVLQSLAAAGVGSIEVVDFDTISISNIHRQVLYSPNVVGEKKAIVAANRLQTLNPFINVTAINTMITEENILELISERDLIIDCTDNLATKFLLHDACFKNRTSFISASIYRFEGQIRTFLPKENLGCLRCAYDETPKDSKVGNCNDFGVLGSSVAVIGSLLANEAILYLNNGTNNTSHETHLFNLENLSQMKIKNLRRENCPTCLGNIDIQESSFEITLKKANELGALLLDIRENEEEVISNSLSHKGVKALYCHRGVRSKDVVASLREKGHDSFFSLKGGARSL